MTKIFIIITSVFVFLGVFFTLLGAKGFFFPKLNKNTDPVKQKESGKLLLKVGLVCLVMSGLIGICIYLA